MDKPAVIVAGHTCLDVIPTLSGGDADLASVLAPGQMRFVGPMVLATGGAVSNTGMALHRLGTPVRLVGKVGDDFIGRATLEIIQQQAPSLTAAMLIDQGAPSSYTVILSSPGLDRTFFHFAGPNDTFCADDVPAAVFEEGKLFHFGYPPLMRRMYLDGGREVAKLMSRAREAGLVTSLDVSQPDINSEAGQVDWPALFANILPSVDIFLPGVEEMLLMFDPGRYAALMESSGGDIVELVTGDLLAELAAKLIDLGVAIVGLKLGDQGMYLRTTADHNRLADLADVLPIASRCWSDRELLAPAFRTHVVGTTGAGDCTIAGFLAGLVKGLLPDVVLQSAVGVGACNVEAADAVSGVPDWDTVRARVTAGWEQISTRLKLRRWGWDVDRHLWIGPGDRGGSLA